jgi:hypothetical protein
LTPPGRTGTVAFTAPPTFMLKHLPSSFAWMAAFFAALGTLFFVLGAHTCYRNWQFAGPVQRTAGTVTDRHFTVSHGRHGSSTSYYVGYRYVDTVGVEYVCNASVVAQTYYSLSMPGLVPVKYLPEFRAINRIDLPAEDRHYETTAWMFMLMGGAFGGFGWYSFLGLERLIFYRRWLRKNGIRCAGRVERIETSSVTVNKRKVHYLVYSYVDSAGRRREDSSEGLSAREEALWSDGEPVEVFCDPRDNSRSVAQLNKR